MTQEHALSKQTRDELTELFTKPVIWEGSEIIKLNKDDAKKLIFCINEVIANDFHPAAALTILFFLCGAIPELDGITTLVHYNANDYRKCITNKTEAKQVCQVIHALVEAAVESALSESAQR